MANLRHVAFITPEPRKLFDYYHHLFDLEEAWLSPTGSILTTDGLFNLAFLQQQAVTAATAGTHRADGAELNQAQGINHFGFTTDRLEDVTDRLDDSIERGMSPQNGRPAEMRIIDPFGNNVDLSSRGFLGREEKELPGVRHVVVQAADPETTCRFFSDAFGLATAGTTPDGSLLLSDGYVSMALTTKQTIGRPGIQYFGLQTDDWPAMQARFRDLGQELGDPPSDGEERMMTDPEGNVFAVSDRGWLP